MSELPPVESAPPQGGQHLPSNPIPRPGDGEQLAAGDPPMPPARYDSSHRDEPDAGLHTRQ